MNCAKLKVKPVAILTMFILFSGMFSCKKEDVHLANDPEFLTSDIAVKWADMSLNIIRHAKYKSPTYSSRSLGYIGITMYESVVYADPSHRSLQGELNQLYFLPIPENNSNYHWPIVLNSSMQSILKFLYPTTTNISIDYEKSIDSLYNELLAENIKGVKTEVVDRSENFGKSLANAIFDWAKSDGGNEEFLHPFDTTFIFPSGDSYWVPPVKGQTITKYPLHPHWGENRTFSYANGQIPIPSISAYSKDSSSEYYKMYYAIYDLSKNLTRTDKEIAAWWADDPTETFSPPGHSFNLATQVIEKINPNLVKAAETYARVGMAVADAFICCWKTKYKYFNERPSTYIRSVIDTSWTPFWPEPPFPAFPSGHSTQSSATATVLTSLYGEDFSFTDNTHEGSLRFPFFEPMPARHYNSFWESAEETGYSRLLGGIHTQQDNIVGLGEGEKIGNNINNMLWER